MLKFKIGVFCLVLLNSLVIGIGAQELRFAVPDYLPFTGEINNMPGGIGVEIVEKIIKEAGMTMQVHVIPNYSRCILEVQNNEVDGFFLGSKNDERDAVAVMTDQIMVNNWIWVTKRKIQINPKAHDFKGKGTVGVMLNTNPHTWLKKNGYNISGTPSKSNALIKMLEANRFDAILIPELIFLKALKDTSGNIDNYQISVQAKQPFAIYISKQYILKHPQILEQLNAAIKKIVKE